MKARIHITRKNGVLDPEGKAIGEALKRLGFGGFEDVRKGTYLEIDLAGSGMDKAEAQASVKEMCEKLLANTVIENYAIEIGD